MSRNLDALVAVDTVVLRDRGRRLAEALARVGCAVVPADLRR